MGTEIQHADVIVIGAGILGMSAAQHLRARGVERVLVVDATTPGSATTGAGAGFVGIWSSGWLDDWGWGADEVRIEQYGLDFYRDLGEREEIGLRACGNLFLALTEAGFDARLGRMATHPLAPAGTRVLTPQDVHDLTQGTVATTACYGAVYHPDGIRIVTAKAVAALAAAFEAGGGTLVTGVVVDKIVLGMDGVVGVETDLGLIRAPTVVTAAGGWAWRLLGDVGMDVPFEIEIATRIVTRPAGLPRDFPTIVVEDVPGLWLREDEGGLTYGSKHGYAALASGDPAWPPTGQRPRVEALVNAAYEAVRGPLGTLIPGVDVSPAGWCQGMPAYTPDRRFIVGGTRRIPGLYVLGADQYAGVMHGPGLGRLLADTVVDGGSDWLDVERYSVDRFALAGGVA